MFSASPQTEQHIILALDHHRRLIEEAKRYRECHAGRGSQRERPLRWRRLRQHIGDLLINTGQRLQGTQLSRRST